MIQMFCYMLAFVCFVFSVWQYASPYWNRIVSVGLAALTLAFFLGQVHR